MSTPKADAESSDKAIKRACRTGLPTQERGSVWVKLAGAGDRSRFYLSALETVFGAGNTKPTKVYRVRSACFVQLCALANVLQFGQCHLNNPAPPSLRDPCCAWWCFACGEFITRLLFRFPT
jgi:hypothetical protein